MSVRIIVDSAADLNNSLRESLITVPMTVHFGDKEYIDGVTITHNEFYEMLDNSDVLPSTSQATPATYMPIFEDLTKSGDEAVVLTLSSTLSGTYQSAMIAAEGFENIYIVDSKTVAIGIGILAEYAFSLIQNGMSAKEIADILEREREKVNIIAMVDTLEYLQKGGRVSKTVAFAGGLLNIKPVIGVTDGEITVLGKARGSKQGNNLLVTEIEKCGGIDFERPVLLGYTGLNDKLLERYIEDSRFLWETARNSLSISQIGSIIGTHVGPDAIAVAFFKN